MRISPAQDRAGRFEVHTVEGGLTAVVGARPTQRRAPAASRTPVDAARLPWAAMVTVCALVPPGERPRVGAPEGPGATKRPSRPVSRPPISAAPERWIEGFRRVSISWSTARVLLQRSGQAVSPETSLAASSSMRSTAKPRWTTTHSPSPRPATLNADRTRAQAWSKAYGALKGPEQPLVDLWIGYLQGLK